MRVDISHVSKRFGRQMALQDVTCTIPSGCRVALIGPNGSGKSTLTRIVLGLMRFEGSVHLDGQCALRHRVTLARRFAYVAQVAPQCAATVHDLLRSAAAMRGQPTKPFEELLERFALTPSSIYGRSFRQLSGGMRQKVLLALALGSEASLLVLDEPTASLDDAARERFFEIFRQRAQKTTLILCSHRLEEIEQLAEQTIALTDGRVVFDGPAQAFLRQSTGTSQLRRGC